MYHCGAELRILNKPISDIESYGVRMLTAVSRMAGKSFTCSSNSVWLE